MAVVVGFIPTEVGFKALAAAREEAEQRGGPLIVVNVLRAGVTDDPRHANDQQLEIARDQLRRATVRVEFRQETTEDDIADILLDVVEKEKAQLLVLGVRRQQDLARHLLGLTVQKLLLSADSEVLVV
ncbi:UspA domain protein [Brachybacterium faecium]|uniref:Universal stress family protein n=1 Tax=Brachybacterium faecium (strain ATCC 43885 / DSM 4810 / JCM 11609 / LMG 19847 / NBRC 14762 / NCIMB 9860 / 6-10) TaxID=446465 RepID=C7MG49_BRAFD|nr:universal stress protein [Brachybacterium faecium]ACU86282.1 universal stress family protein [Brachybacterium faecium DSM 4810]SLM90111.1 UspA domain protein [Brachybacterium faecium]